MEYRCEDCQYYRECPKKLGGSNKQFQPNSLICIAIHENPKRGIQVAKAEDTTKATFYDGYC